MLLSMTGHGHGSYSEDGLSLSVEIRTVNSRYVKINVRCGESYQALEPRIEELIRKRVRRGTIQVNVKIDRKSDAGSFSVNEQVLGRYLACLQNFTQAEQPVAVESLLALPGVIEESIDQRKQIEDDWLIIEKTIKESLDRLTEMRKAEGESMEVDLLKNCAAIESELQGVEAQAPQVAQNYQSRLVDKLNQMLADSGVEFEPADVIKEVGVFADRSDISEETVRLRTHIEQFRKAVGSAESQGRKLDFLTQEMFRETNTIGSKANDAQIAQSVVEMKIAIERIREMVQNVE